MLVLVLFYLYRYMLYGLNGMKTKKLAAYKIQHINRVNGRSNM